MNTYLLVGIVILAIACGIVALVIRIRIADSPAGERWMRRRMQGPFVPPSDDDPKKRAADRGPS